MSLNIGSQPYCLCLISVIRVILYHNYFYYDNNCPKCQYVFDFSRSLTFILFLISIFMLMLSFYCSTKFVKLLVGIFSIVSIINSAMMIVIDIKFPKLSFIMLCVFIDIIVTFAYMIFFDNYTENRQLYDEDSTLITNTENNGNNESQSINDDPSTSNGISTFINNLSSNTSSTESGSPQDGDIICAICLRICNDNSKELECGHIYHNNCIKTWNLTNNTCPLCRKDID